MEKTTNICDTSADLLVRFHFHRCSIVELKFCVLQIEIGLSFCVDTKNYALEMQCSKVHKTDNKKVNNIQHFLFPLSTFASASDIETIHKKLHYNKSVSRTASCTAYVEATSNNMPLILWGTLRKASCG